MKKENYFENYPGWEVFFSNLVSIAIYLIGGLIVNKIGPIWLILYLIFAGILEFRIIRGHCITCGYYYGRTCAFSKGRISHIFLKKGDKAKFCREQIAWKDILPDLMVSLIPIAVGIILLIKDFNFVLLSEIVILLILAFVGNALIRGQQACRHCRQRDVLPSAKAV